VRQLVIKSVKHYLMHGVTMKFKKTQVYLFRLIAITYKVHVWLYLGHLHYKNRKYKNGSLRYYYMFLYMSLCWYASILPKYDPKHVACMWWQLNLLN